ncbi:MAG: radical SAM protein [Armatimonadota bacterium]
MPDAPAAPAREPLVVIPQYFGCLVFDRRTSRYVPFDVEATALLLQLRELPVDAVLARTPDADRRGRIIDFFEQFYGLGYFTLEGRLSATVLDLEVPEDHLAGPLSLHLEVVAACNLTCTHCFAGALPRREEPLSLAELDRLFGEMAALGTFRLGLTGGEPLLRKDLLQIIDLALGHGLCPCLTTNGLLLTEELARELGKRELLWLNVSLEGATAETNDRVRGIGTFDRVLERLELLRKHARFTLAFTLMQSNVAEVEACAELAARVGAHTAVFRPLYPVGTAQEHLDLMPTFQQYHDALDRLVALEGREAAGGFDLRPIDPFTPQLRQETQSRVHQNFGCGAGNLVCSVSVSGDVNPCSFLGPAFVAANVREQSLAEIWHRSQVFQQMRSLVIDEPAGRDETARFAGGCRARALVLNGSVDAPDPWITEQAAADGASARPVRSPLRVLDVAPERRGL